MSLFLDDVDVRLYHGDALTVLRELPPESVHMCVTSPPFFGLRDYQTGRWEGGNPDCDHIQGRPGSGRADGIVDERMQRNRDGAGAFSNVCKCGARRVDQQIGLEETPEQWVDSLVAVFREVRRVLRPEGTLWLEIGDSYAGSAPGNVDGVGATSGLHGVNNPSGKYRETLKAGHGTKRKSTVTGALKPKDLIGAPWQLAKALQAPYYTGTIRDERDRIWLAAMVDAEGSINIHRRPAGQRAYTKHTRKDGSDVEYVRKADSFQPKVEITSTDLALIEHVIRLTGEGNTKVKQEAGTHGRKQTIYRWTLTADKARAFLRELYPHLIAKRHEARLGYNCPSSGPKATAAWQALKELHQGGSPDMDLPPPKTLHEEGWYLRSDIIWARRPNPMPESVTDRPTKSHSYVFLLAKQPRYFFDQEAVREPHGSEWIGRAPVFDLKENGDRNDGGAMPTTGNPAGRNIRSVWNIATQPYPEAHFATFPEELARRCILAGSPEGGRVLDPFVGSGTVPYVARKHGRHAIGIDLSESYLELAARRLQQLSLFA